VVGNNGEKEYVQYILKPKIGYDGRKMHDCSIKGLPLFLPVGFADGQK
jgi:hypothetical protein